MDEKSKMLTLISSETPDELIVDIDNVYIKILVNFFLK